MNLSYLLGRIVFSELARGLFDYRVVGAEKLKFTGPAIIACNHVSFLDPPFVNIAFDEVVHSFARKTLFDNPIAGMILRSWEVQGVDRDKPDAASLKATIRLLRDGKKVLMFPEGTRSHDGETQSAEAGVGLFIAKSKAPVLPVRLFGTYEAYPRGAKTLRPAKITLVVGDLWQPDLKNYSDSGRELYQSLADEVMRRIMELSV
ncbi:lysophospholipid acyltransferase family protein [Prosthecobacter vanneervenii]|uniref:1-acyl-sn-glycerol-3-phosphate acyltransferase n=1 Tax=Prosthecobacter vanneervenii TaxID=48466 RepID=A0A7W7Y9U7_9BACT|nr:lysophospholipid acyltransferase family protein [Prosthecobacter vanneervenii]MBB5032251.1 1-acyl-sn-glycerol-3-phosphate acyltransferase [Prosthecobacter vanneervenii]